MPQSSNKISNFWQELKRRKVVRVITVYAGAAFVILELVDIITDPLKLPEWLLPVVIVLISIGFIIAVILSWIYDIHPEEGIVKTELVDKVKEEEKPKSSNSWKIASYISFVVIVGLIVMNIVPRIKGTGEEELLDKSIAVLPFRNDSPEKDNEYFINGTMESILNNLSKIEDLRVISRSSVEQYRDKDVYIPDVAKKMIVSYVLEGSMQKYGDHIRMTLQLIDRDDNHVWSEQYDRKITKVEEHLLMQSEIAQLVATELQALITPEEKQLIEKIPTTNLTAYDFYQRGQEEIWDFTYYQNPEGLERAEMYFNDALKHDSSFALAYAGLAGVYWNRQYMETYLSEGFQDSALYLAELALTLDDQVSPAYIIKGRYFTELGNVERAVQEFDKALSYNPNDWEAYYHKANLFSLRDNIRTIENLHHAIHHNRGPALPGLLRRLSGVYVTVGYPEKSRQLLEEALQLDQDSMAFIRTSAGYESIQGNRAMALALFERAYLMDSSNASLLEALGYHSSFLGQHQKSVHYYEKWMDRSDLSLDLQFSNLHRVGYSYFMAGQKEVAESYFNKHLEFCLTILELERYYSTLLYVFYDLAGVYAFLGEKEKAYENLGHFNKQEIIPLWMVSLIKDDPLFNRIREEPEFQQIVRDMEDKHRAEHERVRQWLEENDML